MCHISRRDSRDNSVEKISAATGDSDDIEEEEDYRLQLDWQRLLQDMADKEAVRDEERSHVHNNVDRFLLAVLRDLSLKRASAHTRRCSGGGSWTWHRLSRSCGGSCSGQPRRW